MTNEAGPWDVELERQLVSHMLRRPDLIPDVSAHVRAEDFYGLPTRVAFDAMTKAGYVPAGDAGWLAERLAEPQQLDAPGWQNVLVVVSDAASVVSVLGIANRIVEMRQCRDLASGCLALRDAAASPDCDVYELLDQLRVALRASDPGRAMRRLGNRLRGDRR